MEKYEKKLVDMKVELEAFKEAARRGDGRGMSEKEKGPKVTEGEGKEF